MNALRMLLAEPRLEMRLVSAGWTRAPFLGHYNYSRARPALPEHAHRAALEICYLVKGRQTYRVGGRDYHLRGGDVFVTFPGERHGTGGAPEEKGALYWLGVPVPRPVTGFLGLPPPSDGALWRALRDLPERHFPGSLKMKEHLDALTQVFHGGGPLREVELRHFLTGFLLEIVGCGSAPRPVQRRSLEAVRRHIAGHLDQPASVTQLARLARLSVPHFKARFKQEMGVPPAEYQLRARIDEARLRLAGGRHSVTDVAFGLGFSSSQYFATVYKRFTGQSPRSCLPGKKG